MRFVRVTLIQSAYNLRAYTRSTRTVVLGVVMPVGLLVVLSWVFGHQGTITTAVGHPIGAVAFFAGGLTAYGLMLGTFTGVMVGVVSAREAGLLKRFLASPMPPGAYLVGQILFNVMISLALVIVMMGVSSLGYGLRVRPLSLAVLLGLTLLGVFSFTAIALVMTRAIATPELAATAGPFVAITLSFASGVFVPADQLPHWLVSFSSYLPLEPLAQSMQLAVAHSTRIGPDGRTYVVLGLWGVVGFIVARLTFKWQPLRR